VADLPPLFERIAALRDEDIRETILHSLQLARRAPMAGTAIPAYAAGLLTVALARLAAETELELALIVVNLTHVYHVTRADLGLPPAPALPPEGDDDDAR
jgi:hypothetical protein